MESMWTGLKARIIDYTEGRNMKIIVTGGAGFIGSNFVHHMVNKYPEYQIINLDLLTYAVSRSRLII